MKKSLTHTDILVSHTISGPQSFTLHINYDLNLTKYTKGKNVRSMTCTLINKTYHGHEQCNGNRTRKSLQYNIF